MDSDIIKKFGFTLNSESELGSGCDNCSFRPFIEKTKKPHCVVATNCYQLLGHFKEIAPGKGDFSGIKALIEMERLHG